MSTESRAGSCGGGAARPPRLGPVGGVVRLLLAVLLGSTVYDLWVDREFIFGRPDPGTDSPGWVADPLSDLSLWVLTALMVWAIYEVAGFVGWGKRVFTALGLLGLAAIVVALATAGTVWAAPVTWLVWGVDVGMAAVVAVTFLVAVVLRLPGCELGVLRRLARRLRQDPEEGRPMFCVIGLHKLDAWESRRRWHRVGDHHVGDHGQRGRFGS
jgi:hypothetical protein